MGFWLVVMKPLLNDIKAVYYLKSMKKKEYHPVTPVFIVLDSFLTFLFICTILNTPYN
jgi:hypothetical protein